MLLRTATNVAIMLSVVIGAIQVLSVLYAVELERFVNISIATVIIKLPAQVFTIGKSSQAIVGLGIIVLIAMVLE